MFMALQFCLQSETRFSKTSQGYLQITNSIKADSGRFTCIANNGGADAISTAYVGIVGNLSINYH